MNEIPGPNKQWDTQVYAHYTLRQLAPHFRGIHGNVRVGQLPDELRVDGKADFDGILAQYVTELGPTAGTAKARAIFKKVIDDASDLPTRDLFPSKAERIIESRVESFFYSPELFVGGKRELKLASRFRMYDPAPMSLLDDEDEEEDEESQEKKPGTVDKLLAEAFTKVIGCYYVRKPPEKESKGFLRKDVQSLERHIKILKDKLKHSAEDGEAAEIRGKLTILYSRLAATWERIKGIPIPISTFTLTCEHKLLSSSGHVEYLVRVTRYRTGRFIKEKELRRITPKDAARLADFRLWCLGIGDAVFGGDEGGDKDLQRLTKDLNAQSYLREIREVDVFGNDPKTAIWFHGDCAFPPAGPPVLPDSNGIFWHEGMGYQVTSNPETGAEHFCQGAPLLFSPHDKGARANNPDWIIAIKDAMIAEGQSSSDLAASLREPVALALQMQNRTVPPDAIKLIDAAPVSIQAQLRTRLTAAIFKSFCQDLFDTIGDHDGWVALSMMLAYAIGPELERCGGRPGVWLTGKMSSGKTSIGRWLMFVWGFKNLGGIKLGAKSTSAVGLSRAFNQYSNLPILLDEYRHSTIDDEKEETLRGAFDGSGGLKGVNTGDNRTRNPIAKTTPIIMGESSSSDSATRSRYVQIHVSLQKRIGNGTARYDRVQEDCKFYHLIGRWLMENRKAFAESAMKHLNIWKDADETREHIKNDRVRHVYGTAYACYVAATSMLGVHSPEQLASSIKEFQTFLLKHGERGLQDVIDETFLAQFWADIITIRRLGRPVNTSKYFRRKFVVVQPDGTLLDQHAGKGVANHKGAIDVCYIGYDTVYQVYKSWKRATGEDVKLTLQDIRRELEHEKYFLPLPKSDGARCHRAVMGNRMSCWVISLERQPDPTGKIKEEDRPYICPFAEDLIDAISKEVQDAPEDAP